MLHGSGERGAVQGRSKWLRNEKSGDWDDNSGRDKTGNVQNSNTAHGGENQCDKGKELGILR